MAMNNLSNPDGIYIGQSLALPGSGQAASPNRTASGSVASSSSSWTSYIVQPGDTLGDLAWRHQIGLAVLAEVNRISWSQPLYVGQTLSLPSRASVVPPSTGVVPAGQTHTVRYGEHLGTIAARYGTSISAISRANGIANPSHITIGQKLAIPVAGQSAAAASQASTTSYASTTEKWIDVNLSTQTVTAYDGTQAIQSFLVSTGKAWTPTVQGTFRIWGTTPIQDMSGGSLAAGDSYYLADVQHVQYFYQGYAFHAAYWHNNFGTPMSRGCVNMRPADAKWLFDWASPQVSQAGWSYLGNAGTLVKVHD